MKKFIKQVLAFVVPVLILIAMLEIALRHIPNDYRFKHSEITLQKDAIKTLILGSSHSMYGMNPEYFTKKTFNLGHISETIDLDYLMLKAYIDRLPELKTVVVRLSYTTLHEQLGEGAEAWRLKDYQLYHHLKVSNKLKYKSEVLSVKLKNNLSRLKAYYVNDEDMISVTKSGWGYFENEHANGALEDLGVYAAKKHTLRSSALVKANTLFLKQLVELCENKGVEVLLVTLPAHKSYRNHLNTTQLETIIKAGTKMEETYKNCRYYNFMADKTFGAADFYDADHLNASGAKKFSQLINSLIEN
ncbi:DUF1574 family protein [Winogradskyella arenosi]|uniref:Uncharacterized protein DUF1574 n=1 Tax=Winogradskyella arenosi TaxID=533325 RepID=A0A368ZEX5_9FLAO|nr:DUF1574 family protein [Winogradskyella arenosi]RCW92081.1 uncharacterized protein DUF1574 [Winogradskyella arenosi]